MTPQTQAHESTALLAAAQAVVDRWDTPNWKDAEPTAVVIHRLRAAIEASRAPIIATDAMVERVARAMYECNPMANTPPIWQKADEIEVDIYRRDARAAIAAIAEGR